MTQAVVALLAAALFAVGLAPLAGPRSDERFPCEDCGCGCASAIECWTNCCCHTPTERARWALLNSVMVPSWDRATLKAVAAIRAGLGDGVEIERLAPCCRERLLGKAPSTRNDHDTCKARPKLMAGPTLLLCLDSQPTQLPFIAQPVGSVAEIARPLPRASRAEPPEPPPRG